MVSQRGWVISLVARGKCANSSILGKEPQRKRLCLSSLNSERPPSHQLGAAAAPSVRKGTWRAITFVCARNESAEGWRWECDVTKPPATRVILSLSLSFKPMKEPQTKAVLEKPLQAPFSLSYFTASLWFDLFFFPMKMALWNLAPKTASYLPITLFLNPEWVCI